MKRGHGSAPAESNAIDPAVLASLTGGIATAEREILAAYEKATDEDVAALQAALRADDAAAVARSAHRIKGASRMVGMTALARVCDRIEEAGRTKDLTIVPEHMNAFHVELDRVKRHIGSACSAARA